MVNVLPVPALACRSVIPRGNSPQTSKDFGSGWGRTSGTTDPDPPLTGPPPARGPAGRPTAGARRSPSRVVSPGCHGASSWRGPPVDTSRSSKETCVAEHQLVLAVPGPPGRNCSSRPRSSGPRPPGPDPRPRRRPRRRRSWCRAAAARSCRARRGRPEPAGGALPRARRCSVSAPSAPMRAVEIVNLLLWLRPMVQASNGRSG